MAIVSGRRQQIHQDLNLTSESEQHEIEKSVRKEEERAQRKLERQLEIEESASYRLIKGIATLMDKYFLDPILGLLPGVGDALGTIFVLPFIYVSLFKIHSIPLTLAVIYNALVDAALGMIPFTSIPTPVPTISPIPSEDLIFAATAESQKPSSTPPIRIPKSPIRAPRNHTPITTGPIMYPMEISIGENHIPA